MKQPRIAIPETTSLDPSHNERSWPEYAHAVEQSGGVAVKITLSATQTEVAQLATSCQGVLLPGCSADLDPEKYGQERIPECKPCDAAREDVDEILIQDATNMHKPLFGICFGFQEWNVWRGGSLIQNLNTPVNHRPGRDVRSAHEVLLSKDSKIQLLAGCDRVFVNSSHHQGLETPGGGLKVVARCAGDNLIEAVEGAGNQFILAVQWHPERTFDVDEFSRALFSTFLDAVRSWTPRAVRESVVE